MNIILLIIDTLRYDHIRINLQENCFKENNQLVETPNLDRLSEDCLNFTNAYAASFPTIPHRTDIITGRYGGPFHPWKLLDCDIPVLPGILEKEGYKTQLIHDTPHLVNGGHRFHYPFTAWKSIRGAEVDKAWFTDHWKYLYNWKKNPLFDGYLGDKTQEEILKDDTALALYSQSNQGRNKEEDWSTAKLFRAGSRFLEDNANRDDFFLWLDCFAPHEPWDPPPKYVSHYNTATKGKIDPRTFYQELRNNPHLPSKAKRRLQNNYKAMVTFMDRWVGHFLREFRRTGLDKNTALLVTSDHGTNLGDRKDYLYGKTFPPLENEGHVPLLLYTPEGNSGASEALVQPQDIFTTIAKWGGAALPDEFPGNDLIEIAQNEVKGRDIALTGDSVDAWEERSEEPLFSAFDGKWCLHFKPEIEDCKLTKRASQEDLSKENPQIVKNLHKKALEEIKSRGLDPKLINWLESEKKEQFPDNYQITNANPTPPGWSGDYWKRDVQVF